MPLDHLAIQAPPSKYDSIVEFYLKALAPLGYSKQMEFPKRAVGLGPSKETADFWIGSKGGEDVEDVGLHFAFTAKDNDTVIKFYDEALKAGAKDNGPPGPRDHYHPGYFGSFVIDPLG